MGYRCEQAIIGGAREAIRCKVSGSVCAHQKMCMMEGRIVLTDGAMRCPGRSGGAKVEEASRIPEAGKKAGKSASGTGTKAAGTKTSGTKATGTKATTGRKKA